MRDVSGMRWAVRSAWLEGLGGAVLVAAVGACGGNQFVSGGDAGTEDAGQFTPDEACGDNAHARCSLLESCSAEQMTVEYGTEGVCETRLKLTCLNGLSAPSTGNTAARSEACAKAYATESCRDLLDDNPPSACIQSAGSLEAGAPCSFPGQCQTAFCAIVPGAPCGTCEANPQAGDSCANVTTCGQTLTCVTATQTCSAFAGQGSSCTRSMLCGTALFCVGSSSTAIGSCMPSVEMLGAACDPTSKTSAGCDRQQDLGCNSDSKTCASLLPYATTGQPCGTVNDQPAVCGGAGTCTTMDAGVITPADGGAAVATTVSTCVAPAADGAPCDLDNGPGCLSPARCISSTGDRTGTCQFAIASQCAGATGN